MKILFVWPNKDQFGFKPISLALLSAILKKDGHEVGLFDTTYIDFGFKDIAKISQKMRLFKEVDLSGFDLAKKKLGLENEVTKKLEEFKPDVLGVSALSDEVCIGLDISKIAKRWNPKIVVVWGNKAATMAPEKILSSGNVDFACIGEGIEFLPEFIKCLEDKKDPRNIQNIAWMGEDGEVHRNQLRPYFHDLDSLPFLDWSIFDKRQFIKLFDGKAYNGADHMMTWGCPNQCTYCINDSYRKLYGPGAGPFLRFYSVNRIIKELKQLVSRWNIEFFKFHDEDFCLKPMEYFRELAQKYKDEIGIPFTIMANARNINAEKVELLKKMNCWSVSLGIETGNQKIRTEVLKRVETKEQIIEATKLFNAAGIRTSAFNMLGLPFETRETVIETIDLNRRAEVRYPSVGFFFPLDGTELKRISVENGFYDENSKAVFQWERPNLNLPGISQEELTALRERFVLYVKFPKDFYKHIERSEKGDEIGKRLTDELYKIYDACVFANDGIWDDHGKSKEYIKRLEDISQGE